MSIGLDVYSFPSGWPSFTGGPRRNKDGEHGSVGGAKEEGGCKKIPTRAHC